jgi:hypothetical protein
MLVEVSTKDGIILQRIFQTQLITPRCCTVLRYCLGAATTVLCFFPIRTINTRLPLTQGLHAVFENVRVFSLRIQYVSLSNYLRLQNLHRYYGFLLYIQLCCCLLFIVHE